MTIFVVEILKYKRYFAAQPILQVEINTLSLVISEQNKFLVLLSKYFLEVTIDDSYEYSQ